jgi:hydrogenase-4 component F
MIEFLLLFPALLFPLLLIAKKRSLNRIVLISYMIGQSACAVLLAKGMILRLTAFAPAAPFFAADPLSRLFFYLMAILFAAAGIAGIRFLSRSKDDRWDTYYTAFTMLFAASMNGVIFSAHLGLLWVFIEATTLTSAVLIYYDRTRASLEATWKYIFVCSIGIAFAFVGIIMLTIGAGGKDSLFFTDLTANARGFIPFWLKMAYVFLLTGFGTKVGLAPVHAWKPDAYSEAPGPVSALLSGALSNCAFIGIMRASGIMSSAGEGQYARSLLLVMGLLSIAIAAVFMLRVRNYKRMLAYSSIEHMGIVATGIAFGGVAAFAAMIHIAGHSLTKGSLFITAGNIQSRTGTKNIDTVRGLIRSDKATGWLWIAGLLSITAFPPFSTFLSEFLIIKTIFAQNSAVIAAAILFFLTVILFGMFVPIFRMSFGAPGGKTSVLKKSVWDYLPQIILLVAALILGLFIPSSLKELLRAAALVAGI